MSDVPPLVGRLKEVATLAGALESLQSGRAQVLFVEGEPGIGKSRLVAEAVERARSRGLRVLAGTARDLESDLPFAALVEAFDLRRASGDIVRARIRRLLAGTDHSAGMTEARLRLVLIDALLELIEVETQEGPVVLVVEDLQWADRGTLAVLHGVVRRSAHLTIGLVCTARLVPRAKELEDLAEAVTSAGHRLLLGPLGEREVEQLAAKVRGRPPGRALARVLSRAAGNPLFVLELLNAIASDGQLEMPTSLAHTIRRRLAFLSEPTLDLLEMASILGADFDVRQLGIIAEKPILEVGTLLREAVRAGMLEEAHHRLRFRHDLVRDALYENIPSAVRAAFHANAARLLADAGYGPSVVAAHVVRAPVGGEHDVEYLRRAAHDVRATAPDVAARFLDAAAARCPGEYRERAALELERASAHITVGRPAIAADLARSLLRDDLSAQLELEARLVLVWAQLLLGAFEREDLEDLEAAARSDRFDRSQQARLLAEAARAYAHAEERDRGQMLGQEALTAGLMLGDEVVEYLGQVALAGSFYWPMDEQLAKATRLRAYELATASRDPFFTVRKFEAVYLYAQVAQFVPEGRSQVACVVSQGLREAERLGVAWAQPLLHLALGVVAEVKGDWNEALVEYETAANSAEEHGAAILLPRPMLRAARLQLYRGQLETAQQWLSPLLARRERLIPQWDLEPVVHALQTGLTEASGEPDRAFHEICALLARSDVCPPLELLFTFTPGFLRLALATGHAAEARATIEDAARRDPSPPPQGPLPALAFAFAAGNVDAASAALDRIRASLTPLESAEACEVVGDMLIAAGRTTQGIAILKEALERWELLGAEPAKARTAARLRALGVRRGIRGSRARPTSGWESLTGSEQAVVELVVQGFLYREVADRLFISRRTVETHMAHALRKLGVSSRREVVRVLAPRFASATDPSDGNNA